MSKHEGAAMDVTNIRTPGLGDATYVIAHDGLGIVVDPQRDIDRFEQALATKDVELRWVLETHMHNDYISGGKDLAARHGADIVLPAGSGAGFNFTPAFHNEDLPAERGLTVRPVHPPGHTPEHVSYIVLVDGQPVGVFSGGSLLVGSSGRPDLLSEPQAEPLARLQFISVNRLAELPDDVALYPTHGEGSFCTASGAGKTTSTIGDEKRDNPVLHQPDADSFVKFTMSDLQPWPSYYQHMGPANVFSPTAILDPAVPEISPEDVAGRDDEVVVLDGRPRARYAEAHIPGSFGIELGEQFGVWAGWVLPYAAPVQLVLDPDQDAEEAVRQLARVGFDDVRGVLRGLDGWVERGLATRSLRLASTDELARALDTDGVQVVDVRAPNEVEVEPLPGALHAYVPELKHEAPPELDPGQPTWVVCGSGYRTSIAAGLLDRLGHEPILVDGGGVGDVLAARAGASA